MLRLVENGERGLWEIVERVGSGWRLRRHGTKDREVRTDGEIHALYKAGNLEHTAANPDELSSKEWEILQKPKSSHSPADQFVIDVRAQYCAGVQALLDDPEWDLGLGAAAVSAARTVRDEHLAEWTATVEGHLASLEHAKKGRRRRAESVRKAKSPSTMRRHLEPFSGPTIVRWYKAWLRGGRQEEILVPRNDEKGNRTPRLQDFDGKDPYSLIEAVLEKEYVRGHAPSLRSAYAVFAESWPADEHYVSYKSFVAIAKSRFSQFEADSARGDRRLVALRHKVHTPLDRPGTVLVEAEIDHTLVDLAVVGEEPWRRLIGRPWLTLLQDRASRAILGMHVSFEVPSYAAVQRCLLQAFSTKDVTGFGLVNDWPCEGIPQRIILDNGKEFQSSSMRRAARELDFTLEYMPPRTPWMKGMVESCFKTFNAKVYDLNTWKKSKKLRDRMEKTKPSLEDARTLPELREMLLRFVIDNYHVSRQRGISRTNSNPGQEPMTEWFNRLPPDGLRFVRDPSKLNELLLTEMHKPIGQYGITVEGMAYTSPDLTRLLRTNGRGKLYELRVDPWDMSEIQLFDTTHDRWLRLGCTDPDLSKGTTIHQAKVRFEVAKNAARRRGIKSVTTSQLRAARDELDRAALEAVKDSDAKRQNARLGRYLETGATITPVAGVPQIADGHLMTRAASTSGTADEMIPPVPLAVAHAATPIATAPVVVPARTSGGRDVKPMEETDEDRLRRRREVELRIARMREARV